MPVLLHIDASVDRKTSITRELSGAFVKHWSAHNPLATILRRDLASSPAPPLSGPFVRAVKTPLRRRTWAEKRAWRASEKLSEEFLAADRYAVGMPMHILTAPSVFKSYVEQIFHEERVFKTAQDQPEGLLGGRKFLFLISKGADYRPGSPLAAFDMLEPYLIKLLTFCGVAKHDINFIAVNNALLGNDDHKRERRNAERQIEKLAKAW